jgi:hypothetical protein
LPREAGVEILRTSCGRAVHNLLSICAQAGLWTGLRKNCGSGADFL